MKNPFHHFQHFFSKGKSGVRARHKVSLLRKLKRRRFAKLHWKKLLLATVEFKNKWDPASNKEFLDSLGSIRLANHGYHIKKPAFEQALTVLKPFEQDISTLLKLHSRVYRSYKKAGMKTDPKKMKLLDGHLKDQMDILILIDDAKAMQKKRAKQER